MVGWATVDISSATLSGHIIIPHTARVAFSALPSLVAVAATGTRSLSLLSTSKNIWQIKINEIQPVRKKNTKKNNTSKFKIPEMW